MCFSAKEKTHEPPTEVMKYHSYKKAGLLTYRSSYFLHLPEISQWSLKISSLFTVAGAVEDSNLFPF